jgi:hypothetical protein
MAFGIKPKAGIPAKGQPRPGGAINQGGQSNPGSSASSFALPSKSTGTMKKNPASAPRGFSKAQQPAQDGQVPPSLAALVRGNWRH